jgi:hypothetical protein
MRRRAETQNPDLRPGDVTFRQCGAAARDSITQPDEIEELGRCVQKRFQDPAAISVAPVWNGLYGADVFSAAGRPMPVLRRIALRRGRAVGMLSPRGSSNVVRFHFEIERFQL